MPHMTPGQRIAALRIEHHETQEDLAEVLGCTAGQVGHIERGVRRLFADDLHAIAKHYRVSTDWLLTGEATAIDPPAGDIARALRDASPAALDAVRAVLALSRSRPK